MGSGKTEKIVIVGASHGAVAVVETLRREGFRGRVTLISDEKVPVCSPTALPYVFGNRGRRPLTLRPAEFFEGLHVVEGKAVSVEPDKSRVLLASGARISYDRLVLATGAGAARLPVETPGDFPIHTLRSAQDLQRLEERAKRGRTMLVVGAGLIGLHMAHVLHDRGKTVRVVEMRDQVLPGMIPPEPAERLKRHWEAKGISIDLGTSLSEIRGHDAVLSSGEEVRCDLVVAAIGIRPNFDIVRGLSVAVREGILVDEGMETHIPGIFACGDVAEYRDFFTGETRLNPNVLSAAEQGKRAAHSLMGKRDPHPGVVSVNVFRCPQVELVSVGRFMPDPGDALLEEKGPGSFKRFVFREGLLKGMVLLNAPADPGLYYRFLQQRISLQGLEEKILKDPLNWGRRIGERTFRA